MAKKYDDFDEPDSDGIASQILGIVSRHKREFAIVSVSAAVILLGLVVFGGYPDSEDSAQNDNVPIVRADSGDYKTAPDNPGGMEIPYRDSTVFSSTTPQKTDAGTENILADDSAEQPVPRAQLFAGLNTEGQPGQPVQAPAPAPDASVLADASSGAPAPQAVPSADAVINEAIGVGTTHPSSAGAAPSTAATAPAPVQPVEVPAAVPEQPRPAAVSPAPAKSAPAKTAPSKSASVEKSAEVAKTEPAAGVTASAKGVQPGGYYVQLASVKSQSAASTEWKKFQAKYSALGGLTFRSQEVNLGSKGTFYRIQAGPMSKDSASKVCASVKSAGGTCLVASK